MSYFFVFLSVRIKLGVRMNLRRAETQLAAIVWHINDELCFSPPLVYVCSGEPRWLAATVSPH
jgi:hypothetical protein